LVDRLEGAKRLVLLKPGDPPIEVGIVHEIAGARPSIKATCRIPCHKGCVCWVSNAAGDRRDRILFRLATWFRDGESLSKAEHQTQADGIKVYVSKVHQAPQHPVRVRKKTSPIAPAHCPCSLA
jgi:hypothetical protein